MIVVYYANNDAEFWELEDWSKCFGALEMSDVGVGNYEEGSEGRISCHGPRGQLSAREYCQSSPNSLELCLHLHSSDVPVIQRQSLKKMFLQRIFT